MRAPLARLKSSYCPCTVPSAYLSAVNENVRSSPAMVNCPAPVADCTTGPLSWPSIVSAPDDLAIVSVVEPPSQPARTTANRVVVQRGIPGLKALPEIGSRIPDPPREAGNPGFSALSFDGMVDSSPATPGGPGRIRVTGLGPGTRSNS